MIKSAPSYLQYVFERGRLVPPPGHTSTNDLFFHKNISYDLSDRLA
jgi:hypothetical protein